MLFLLKLSGLLALLFAATAAAAHGPPAATGPEASASAPVVLHCGRLLDPVQGRLLGASSVVVRGGRIERVADGHVDLSGLRRIDLGVATCLPGLIDSHVHLSDQIGPDSDSERFRLDIARHAIRSTLYARRTLLAGFTTVRNLGDNGYETVDLRDAIAAGEAIGPRIVTAGMPIGTTGGHADPSNGFRAGLAGDPGPAEGMIDGVEGAWKAVRTRYKRGADAIKIMASGGFLSEAASADNAQMTAQEMQAVVAAARDYGFRVTAHAHGAEAVRRAVLAGVDSIEHGSYVDDEGLRLMKARGTWFVPTISPNAYTLAKAEEPGYYPSQVADKIRAAGLLNVATAGRAYRAGVRIAFGSDAGVYPHGENARELELMVQAGMPPMFVLQAATVNAARMLGLDDEIGAIAAGLRADVVAVPGNPLHDIGLMREMLFVMKDGVVHREPPAAAAPADAPSGSR